MKFPKFYNRYKAQIASASSLESFLKTSISKSATESIEDPGVQAKAADYLHIFMQKVVADAIKDGRIFFSADPNLAYEEFKELLCMPEVRDAVIEELTCCSAQTEFDRYKQLADRFSDMTMECDKRKEQIDELIECHPEWRDEI